MRNLIIASENKLAMMAEDRQSHIEEIVLETTILKASKQLEDRLERFLLFFETQ